MQTAMISLKSSGVKPRFYGVGGGGGKTTQREGEKRKKKKLNNKAGNKRRIPQSVDQKRGGEEATRGEESQQV